MNIHPNEINTQTDMLTQYQLNANKLDNINSMDEVFGLEFQRSTETINIKKRSQDEIDTFETTFKDSTFEIMLISSEGEFDYTSEEFYMTDLAGTTTYMVNAEFNIISIKTTDSDLAIGAPQVIQFTEKSSDTIFNMAITDQGDLEITK